ncbi:MAG: class I SAM-dependent methyltransferase [Candidatus Kuenenia sp.]|nr:MULTISPECIES: class I SAM-dependent methyltransferase [Kuenenia]MCZ7622147.1 class I SAM-dependent methyltransferase [Candidatus Kuenenia sp.]
MYTPWIQAKNQLYFFVNVFGMGEKAKVGYSQETPFNNLLFDAVVISEVIEHLTDEAIENTLSEISRILMPGGQIIGTVPAREKISEQRAVCPNCAKHFHRWGHIQTFDSNRIQPKSCKQGKALLQE